MIFVDTPIEYDICLRYMGFIDRLLDQFCPLWQIQSKNECQRALEQFVHTPSLIGELGQLDIDLGEPFTLVASSGESLILLFPESGKVLKIFDRKTPAKKLTNEVKIARGILRKAVVPVLSISNTPELRAIVYKQIVALSAEYLGALSDDELDRLITDVVMALDAFHLAGYTHGDPGHRNIGYDAGRQRYVLMDLEDAVKHGDGSGGDGCVVDGARAYNEIIAFLEDLRINLSRKEQSERVSALIESLQEEHVKVREVVKEFMGKKRIRKMTIVDFTPGTGAVAILAIQ